MLKISREPATWIIYYGNNDKIHFEEVGDETITFDGEGGERASRSNFLLVVPLKKRIRRERNPVNVG